MLNPRQEAFCLAYARTGNATRAAEEAGYSKPNTQGPRLLVNVGIKERLKELTELAASAKIATAKERQEFWTSVFRGDLPEFEPKDRLKASELLGKAQGDFIDRTEVSGPNGAGLELLVTRRIITADAEP